MRAGANLVFARMWAEMNSAPSLRAHFLSRKRLMHPPTRPGAVEGVTVASLFLSPVALLFLRQLHAEF